MPDEPTTGAMPGAGATPAQVGQPMTTTPAAPGATPPAGTTAPAAAAPSATDDAALGEAGNRILREARRQAKEAEDRAKAAEAERDALRSATQSEAEKATMAAVKEAEKVITATFEARIRRSEVRSALTAAGITATELDLAMAAPEFVALKVTDDGIDGLPETVKAFKAAHAALFAKPAAPVGDAGGGVRGQSGSPSIDQQLAEARQKGDHSQVIRLELQRMAAKPA